MRDSLKDNMSSKILKIPLCMSYSTCANCFIANYKLMYYFENNYYCVKCIDSKATKIREYKFFI